MAEEETPRLEEIAVFPRDLEKAEKIFSKIKIGTGIVLVLGGRDCPLIQIEFGEYVRFNDNSKNNRVIVLNRNGEATLESGDWKGYDIVGDGYGYVKRVYALKQ